MRGRNSLENEIRSLKRAANRRPLSTEVTVGNWSFFETEDGGLGAHNLSSGQIVVIAQGDGSTDSGDGTNDGS